MSDIEATNSRTLGRCCCIITGASKGFGRVLAYQVCQYLKPSSVLLLVARSGSLLEKLKEELHSYTEALKLVVHCTVADLSTREGVNLTVNVARQEAVNEIDHVLLINNASSLGDLSQFSSFTDLDEVNSFLAFNVSSPLALTAGILKAFPVRTGLRWTVVNCSSKFAQEAKPSWVLYCSGKAAREMMFRVLAEEEPRVKVLSYAPGPMDTEMQEDIRRRTGLRVKLLPCHESATKLLKVVLDDSFASGKHLDFFDI
ncbi:sepiapterin reductase b [Aulostomus maculatus]